MVLHDTGFHNFTRHGQPGVIQLVQFQDIVAPDHHQQFFIGKPQHLIRCEKPALPLPLCLPVLGNHLRNSQRFLYRHGGIDLYAHIAAARRKILGAHIIRAAQHELYVAVADDLGPQIIGIPVLQLSQTLHRKHYIDGAAADNREGSGEVRAICRAAQLPNIVELVENEIDRYRTAYLRSTVRITDKLDEEE